MSSKKSFQLKLFLSVGGIFLLFAFFFCIYQYGREKSYKTNHLQSLLQIYNYELYQSLGKNNLLDSLKFNQYVSDHGFKNIRVTIIDTTGIVLIDSNYKKTTSLSNHLNRPEVYEALKTGKGYNIKRESESTNQTYFYVATRFNNYIVRAAVPYSSELTQKLQADNSYIIYTMLITILMGWVLYRNTQRIGRHIEYLRLFAQKVENGEQIDTELNSKLPNDELSDISRTIVTLFWKLRHSEEDKQRIKRQLTLNVAHELKTPAASIQGFLETILQNPTISEDKKEHFLQRCHAQSERMCKLLYDMDSLTKLDDLDNDGENRKLEKKSIDVKNIIHAVLDDTALQRKTKDILATLDIPSTIQLMGDASLIYSIFRNLIDNSIAYATSATTIDISCLSKTNYYEFIVSDNGIGVPEEHLPHIFERFYRVDKGRSRKVGGTGLGLAIVKNAIALHGGTCMAYATPGGGLSIKFTLNKK